MAAKVAERKTVTKSVGEAGVEKVVESTPVRNPFFDLVEMAIEKDADITKIERLVELFRSSEQAAARKNYYRAMAAFQAELPAIKKTKEARFSYKEGGGEVVYKYAPLGQIAEQIRPYLDRHGFSYRFEQSVTEQGWLKVTCIVTHLDGHLEQCEMIGMLDATGRKNILQQGASTTTYLMRYTLSGVFGIATIDDDIDGFLLNDEKPFDNPAPADPYAEYEQVEGDTKPPYPDEKFCKNFPKWAAAINVGDATADSIIAMISSRFTLTPDQVDLIKNANT